MEREFNFMPNDSLRPRTKFEPAQTHKAQTMQAYLATALQALVMSFHPFLTLWFPDDDSSEDSE